MVPASRKRSDRAVLVVHGRSSSRTGDNGELVAQAAALVDGGYNVLLFDFRAHGLSGGTRYTLGADEQGDVLGAVAYLESRGFAPDRLGFWAHSMGAATVLLAAGASADVRTIVADSSFARLEDLLARELPRESGLPGFFNPAILYFGRELFGLDTRVLNPVEAVAALPPRSLFVIHAEEDRLIPVDHARRIAAAAGPAVWDLWIFPGRATTASGRPPPSCTARARWRSSTRGSTEPAPLPPSQRTHDRERPAGRRRSGPTPSPRSTRERTGRRCSGLPHPPRQSRRECEP